MSFGKPNVVKKANSGGNGGGGHISLRPSDGESGGLLDDVNATVIAAAAVTWDYNGNADPGPALHIRLKDDNGQEADQYYSAGKLERVVPTEDGEQFDPAEGSSAKGLNQNCNAFVFLSELVNKGFPEDKLASLGTLVGLYGHFNRVPQKQRAGLENADGKQRTILIVTKIHSMPWEKKGTAGKASSPSANLKSTSTASTNNGGNGNSVNDEAVAAVMALVAEGPVEMKKLGMQIFKSTPTSKNRAAIVKLVTTEDFITQDNAPWSFDGETLSAAE